MRKVAAKTIKAIHGTGRLRNQSPIEFSRKGAAALS
jgi:hypothetical protein